MNQMNKKVILEQLDKKMQKFANLKEIEVPIKGWIYTLRKSLNISLSQLGKKLGITAQSAKEIEEREQNRSLTLKRFYEVANVLDMKFVYGFIPKENSLREQIEKRAFEVAREIVMRTSHMMSLEDQKNTDERLKEAIKERAEKIQREMPRFLWD